MLTPPYSSPTCHYQQKKPMNPYVQDSPSTSSITKNEEEIKKNLFQNAMKGNWDQVIQIYQQHGAVAHTAKITRSGDTAIHIAISDGQVSTVEKLVFTAAEQTPAALQITNELGNTPLHLAASLGSVTMCRCIADVDEKLIGIRNRDGETPFFQAVHHGQKDAFLCLHSLCKDGVGYTYGRRNDGETILHSAISGEYFDIAFQIIHLYEKVVNSVNEQGFSPLHLLASKPSAFRSGSHIRGFHALIYHCIFVDELEEESSYRTLSDELKDGANNKYPDNYQTCVAFFLSFKNLVRVLTGDSTKPDGPPPDAEAPKGQQSHQKQEGSSEKCKNQQANEKGQQFDTKQEQGSSKSQAQGHQYFFPENYLTCFHGLKLLSKIMLVVLGLGSMEIVKIREKKEKHVWSVQIMEKLLEHASMYEYEDNGRSPQDLPYHEDGGTIPYTLADGGAVHFSQFLIMEDMAPDAYHPPPPPPPPSDNNSSKPANKDKETHGNERKENCLEMEKKETPILIAAKNGVMEMVERILEQFPVAVHDTNNENENVVLLAVENRQPHVYNFLLGLKLMKEIIFRKTDKGGNSALHLAARLGEHRPWLIPGAALQMQWEIKWYEFVKNSMPHHFFVRYNIKGETPRDIFSATHQELVKEGGEWLTNTSESCSVVAALIATVAFATSSTVPGGVNSDSGTPTLEKQPAFSIFAISSLIALCFSVTSVVMFLAILTSRYQEKDFGMDLPRKLLVGLTSLFVSIASMLVSFCAGHFFVLKDKLKYAAFPVYAVTCLPVTFFAVAQFSLYFDLVWATFKKVPQRSYK